MKRFTALFWPIVGLAAVVGSFYMLFSDPDFTRLTAGDVYHSLKAISPAAWLCAIAATLIAYSALAWYDRIALAHLGHRLSWVFISLVSFTTYALSHNIGASAFSGAVVRYRAYSTKGLTVAEVGVLVAFCAFTFALGMVLLGGIVLVADPGIVGRLSYVNAHIHIHRGTSRLVGELMLGFVAFYVAGSLLQLKPLVIGSFRLAYPRFDIVVRQLMAGPMELVGAAGIIYFSLPQAGNPGYFIVLAVFLASFALALISHAPGGLGVLEAAFLSGMPGLPKAQVIAALIVFRLLYLIIPLIFAIGVVILFERGRLAETLRRRGERVPDLTE